MSNVETKICNTQSPAKTEQKIRSFQDLVVWQKGHALVPLIYKMGAQLPNEEIYGLKSQLQRAAVSVTSNIAEGFSRYHYKEKINFYYIARGSISETQNLLLILRDIHYVTAKEVDPILQQADEVRRPLNGLIRSTQDQLNV